MGEQLAIRATDGHRLGAYLATPEGEVRGGLVVIQEAFGLTAYVRSVCDAFAADGYRSIAPALYDRQQRGAAYDDYQSPDSLASARKLRAALVWDDVLADVAGAIDEIKASGKVGIVGYCVGGSVAWLAAASLPVAAASSYYGRDVVDFLDRPPRCPVQLHFGENDHLIPPADIERIRAAYPAMPIYVYPGGHGFDGPGARHQAQSSTLARERTLGLFREHIG